MCNSVGCSKSPDSQMYTTPQAGKFHIYTWKHSKVTLSDIGFTMRCNIYFLYCDTMCKTCHQWDEQYGPLVCKIWEIYSTVISTWKLFKPACIFLSLSSPLASWLDAKICKHTAAIFNFAEIPYWRGICNCQCSVPQLNIVCICMCGAHTQRGIMYNGSIQCILRYGDICFKLRCTMLKSVAMPNPTQKHNKQFFTACRVLFLQLDFIFQARS